MDLDTSQSTFIVHDAIVRISQYIEEEWKDFISLLLTCKHLNLYLVKNPTLKYKMKNKMKVIYSRIPKKMTSFSHLVESGELTVKELLKLPMAKDQMKREIIFCNSPLSEIITSLKKMKVRPGSIVYGLNSLNKEGVSKKIEPSPIIDEYLSILLKGMCDVSNVPIFDADTIARSLTKDASKTLLMNNSSIEIDFLKRNPDLIPLFSGNSTITLKDIIENPFLNWNIKSFFLYSIGAKDVLLMERYLKNDEDLKILYEKCGYANHNISIQDLSTRLFDLYRDIDKNKIVSDPKMTLGEFKEIIGSDIYSDDIIPSFGIFCTSGVMTDEEVKDIIENSPKHFRPSLVLSFLCNVNVNLDVVVPYVATFNKRDIIPNNISMNPTLKIQHMKILKPNLRYDGMNDITSNSKSITIHDIISTRKEYSWGWYQVSSRPDVTMKIVLDNPDIPWDPRALFVNPSITYDDILNNPSIGWPY